MAARAAQESGYLPRKPYCNGAPTKDGALLPPAVMNILVFSVTDKPSKLISGHSRK
jgi:hypothetical protein